MKATKRILSITMAFTFLSTLTAYAQTTTVKFGKHQWMDKNLNVTHFRNGDPILHAQTKAEWEKAGDNKQPAWCYAQGSTTEIFYNWIAVNDPRGLAPEGFRVATQDDWSDLGEALGGLSVAGEKLRENKFKAVSVGWRKAYTAAFGIGASWWAHTEVDGGSARIVKISDPSLQFIAGTKLYGHSVRCVKED